LCLKWAWADDANQKLAHQPYRRLQVPILRPRGVSIKYDNDVGYQRARHRGSVFMHAEMKQLCAIGSFASVTATATIIFRDAIPKSLFSSSNTAVVSATKAPHIAAMLRRVSCAILMRAPQQPSSSLGWRQSQRFIVVTASSAPS